MTTDLLLVLALLAAAIVMFSMDRPRMDVVALIMMAALPLTGVISVEQALAGLSDPNIVLIAAMFVIGEALVRTGVARMLGDFLVRHAGHSETRLIVLLMLLVATVGSVMSSAAIVAIFIPVVLRIADNARHRPRPADDAAQHGVPDQRHDDPRRHRAQPRRPERADPARP